MRRSLVLFGILGLGVTGVWVHAAQQPATAPPAQTFNPANFTGTVTPRGDDRHPHEPVSLRSRRAHQVAQPRRRSGDLRRGRPASRAGARQGAHEFEQGVDVPRGARRHALARRSARRGHHADLTELRDDELDGAGERSGLQARRSGDACVAPTVARSGSPSSSAARAVHRARSGARRRRRRSRAAAWPGTPRSAASSCCCARRSATCTRRDSRRMS